MYKLVSDSSCDLLQMEGVAFASVPLTISTDERTYIDDEHIDAKEMMDYLAGYRGRSYTACPSIESWMKAYEGADEVYVTCLTSGLSGTYNSAMNARELFLQDHPDVKIAVFDTLTAGPQLPLILQKIKDLKEEGKTFEEVCEMIQAYMPKTRLLFAFQSLHNFAQNGRVSKVVAAATGMLGIRIIGTASSEGTIEVISKARGDKKAAAALLNELENMKFNGNRINICHADNEKAALALKEKVLAKYPNASVRMIESRGICSYYGEQGAVFFGFEVE
ncbi:MAG: DegV family protein [Eubacteriales bacterium]|nr:DegV family protein [Eubacteriales bacterium]